MHEIKVTLLGATVVFTGICVCHICL